MGDIRSIKAQARAAVHERASRPVYVFLTRGSMIYEERAARVHRKPSTHGDLQGTSFHYAARDDLDTFIVFSRQDSTSIARGTVIVVDANEGYEVDRELVPDGDYVTFAVTALTRTEAAAFPFPPMP